ncbi:MAG: hypothetical protein IPK22_10915 [Verrucomicrobiaceae bacterium]|nr:hypothetical protein [Verrucomicrobiaceae bacterium]
MSICPDKAVSEWAVRVYKLPKSFPQDKTPVEVLKASGIAFPKGADASLKDGKLTVRNTKANLELIEVWLDALIQREVKKSVHLSVKAVEMKGDHVKQLHHWLLPAFDRKRWTPPMHLQQPSRHLRDSSS